MRISAQHLSNYSHGYSLCAANFKRSRFLKFNMNNIFDVVNSIVPALSNIPFKEFLIFPDAKLNVVNKFHTESNVTHTCITMYINIRVMKRKNLFHF